MKNIIIFLFAIMTTTQLIASEVPSLSCSGTEPFWGLTTQDSVLSLDLFDDNSENFEITNSSPAVGTGPGWTTLIKAKSGMKSISLITRKEACNDGMSDKEYSYSAYLQMDDTLFIGCCSDR